MVLTLFQQQQVLILQRQIQKLVHGQVQPLLFLFQQVLNVEQVPLSFHMLPLALPIQSLL